MSDTFEELLQKDIQQGMVPMVRRKCPSCGEFIPLYTEQKGYTTPYFVDAIQHRCLPTTSAPVESELAALFLAEQLEKGRTIEIPSLGITITKDMLKP